MNPYCEWRTFWGKRSSGDDIRGFLEALMSHLVLSPFSLSSQILPHRFGDVRQFLGPMLVVHFGDLLSRGLALSPVIVLDSLHFPRECSVIGLRSVKIQAKNEELAIFERRMQTSHQFLQAQFWGPFLFSYVFWFFAVIGHQAHQAIQSSKRVNGRAAFHCTCLLLALEEGLLNPIQHFEGNLTNNLGSFSKKGRIIR